MASKNGAPELISMLQYMKESNMNNPEILVKDERIIELDKIVTEVKESEEWEAVRMNILEIGIEHGAKMKLKELVQKKLEKGCTIAEIADILEEEEELVLKIAEELGYSCDG